MAPAQLIELDVMPQLDEWPLDYVMATALVCNPLCFARFTALTPERRAAIRAWIDAHAGLRRELAGLLIVPVGPRPAQDGWSGFAAVAPDDGRGFLVAYRNGAGAPAAHTFDLRGLGLGRVRAEIAEPLGYRVVRIGAPAPPRGTVCNMRG